MEFSKEVGSRFVLPGESSIASRESFSLQIRVLQRQWRQDPNFPCRQQKILSGSDISFLKTKYITFFLKPPFKPQPFAFIHHPGSTQSWQGIRGLLHSDLLLGTEHLIFFFFLKFLFPSTTSANAQPVSFRHQETIPANRSPVFSRESPGKGQLSSPAPSENLVDEKTRKPERRTGQR